METNRQPEPATRECKGCHRHFVPSDRFPDTEHCQSECQVRAGNAGTVREFLESIWLTGT